MKGSMLKTAVVGVAAASFWPSLSRAQQTTVVEPQPTTVVSAPTRTVDETTWEATGPSWPMVGSGLGTFALSYLPVVVVAAESPLNADQNLYIPIVGPWIDFAQRPGCPAVGSCATDTTDKVLLATDGVFQAIGAITIVDGFLTTAHERRTVQSAALRPKLQVAPAQVGKGYGLMALGSF